MEQLIDCHNHVGVEMSMYLRGDYPYAQHLDTLVKDGRAAGIGQWIVFPMVTHLAFDLPALQRGEVVPGGLEKVPYAWENRRLMREIHLLFPELSASILPFAMLDPSREVPAQIQALRELRQDFKFHGLKMQTTMLESPIKDLLGVGRPFLDFAEEWDLPLLIHSSVLPADRWAQASDIIDIVEATPQLRFCVAHSCRFDKPSLDRIAQLPNCWFDCSAHGIHCQLAVKEHPAVATPERRFPSDYSRPDQVLIDLANAYPDKLLWGSDSPYESWVAAIENDRMALISSYELEAGYLHAVEPALKTRIARDNTLKYLGGSKG